MTDIDALTKYTKTLEKEIDHYKQAIVKIEKEIKEVPDPWNSYYFGLKRGLEKSLHILTVF